MRLPGLMLLAATMLAQSAADRPKILGVAHMAVYVSDLARARAFYEGLLGYEEPFTLPKPDGSVRIAFVKINDGQYLELFTDPNVGEGQLNHIAFATDSADRMRDYLAAHGVKVPAKVPKGLTGNKNFTVKDADGHGLEIVEYQPDSWTARESGKYMPASRISDRLLHVGILVGKLEAANRFYNRMLGFQEFWRGGAANSNTLSWVNMRVPEGQDYVEFMLYGDMPAPEKRGNQHHICLVVPDMEKAVEALQARPAAKAYGRPTEIRTGINRKRQCNLYDPDGTRVELMEASTVDGKPAPSSTLPPPR